jgi:hypothetical protein
MFAALKAPSRCAVHANSVVRSPGWHAAYDSSRDQLVLWITSMSGMRVIDAHLYVGCRHFQPLKVHHQPTLAGIEGATFLTGPEHRDLPGGSTGLSEVNDGWRHTRYLTRRGILQLQEYPNPWLPTIPATPLHHGGVCRHRSFLPCDDVRPKYGSSLVADGNERFTLGIRKRIRHSSHPGRSTGVRPLFSTRLLSIPTSMEGGLPHRFHPKAEGVSILVSRRVVPAGRLASRG